MDRVTEMDEDPWVAIAVLEGKQKGDKDYAILCLLQLIMLEFPC